MSLLDAKFAKLGVDSAPGQESRQESSAVEMKGDCLDGTPVDFSHGDVNAFAPIPGALETFIDGYREGADQAYTEYRGRQTIRESLSEKLAVFTGSPVDAERELILTPGTQGALFLAMGASIGRGDKVAIVEPDYFANRKLVEFFDGEIVPVQMNYLSVSSGSGLDLGELEEAFKSGVKLFIFSNPNNPTGVVYSRDEVTLIGKLAQAYGVVVIADELYSRQIFDAGDYTHLRALNLINPDNMLTIIGPSKTESLSGFRLGAAFGSATIIDRMEKLQAIVSLRAAGYCQSNFRNWFSEPDGWLAERVKQHQAIRDDLHTLFAEADGFTARLPEGGSYLFPTMPDVSLDVVSFTQLLRQQASVSVTPGIEFGPQFKRSFRLNFSQDHATAVSAIERVIQITERYRL